MRVIEADALKADWPAILGSDRWVLVANLPYNVATPLIADLLDGVPQIHRMLVMVQREVGERLAASAGDEAYGAVSVKIAVLGSAPRWSVGCHRPCSSEAQGRVRARAHRRREVPAVGSDVDPDWLFTLVRAGFGHRRKMLRGSLQGVATVEQIEAAGIAPTARAEEPTSPRGVDSPARLHLVDEVSHRPS